MIDEILSVVAKKIEPNEEEKLRIQDTANKIVSILKELCKKQGFDIKVEIGGSIGKGTWLSGEADIDIFMLFPLSIELDRMISLGLNIARKTTEIVGGVPVEKYAQHPYIETYINGVTIDIVPAYQIEHPSQIKTAADRSSLHLRYVNSKLNDRMRKEIRILKRFLKGINVYGSEIKTQGFSGYLCELLIIYYGSFINLLRNAIKWIPWRTYIDIENFYGGDMQKIFKKFNSPIVVIDPVDKNRNAAAAVSMKKLLEFKTASKFFLNKPSFKFFFPEATKPITLNEFQQIIYSRKTYVVCLLLPIKIMSPDIIWGIGFKVSRKLRNILEKYDYRVLDIGVWTDEREILAILFEVENISLPYVKKHLGPPVGSVNEMDFIKKYFHKGEMVAGPFIEGGRWVVYKPRRYVSIRDLLLEYVFQISNVRKFLSKDKIYFLLNEEVLKTVKDKSFLIYLKEWLVKKYKWL